MPNETQGTVGAGADLFEDAPAYSDAATDEPEAKRSAGNDAQNKRQDDPGKKGTAGQDAQNRRNKDLDE